MNSKSNESYKFKIGDFDCIVLSDGAFSYPDHSFFVNAPKESLEQVFREHNIPPGEITVPWICLFINTGQQWVLVDTGAGAGSVPTAGRLLQNLQNEGIEPVDVDMVIITHGHPDHIGGNTDSEGRLVFPNARYVMLKEEWEFWTSEPDLTQLKVSEEIKQTMRSFAAKNLPPLQARLRLVDNETQILPGIWAIAAPGHTPGHMALAISSDNDRLLYLSDTVLHPIHLEQPDWYPAFDLMPEQAMITRRQLLNRIAARKVPMIASHFPFPGMGHIVRKGEGWQWQPWVP